MLNTHTTRRRFYVGVEEPWDLKDPLLVKRAMNTKRPKCVSDPVQHRKNDLLSFSDHEKKSQIAPLPDSLLSMYPSISATPGTSTVSRRHECDQPMLMPCGRPYHSADASYGMVEEELESGPSIVGQSQNTGIRPITSSLAHATGSETGLTYLERPPHYYRPPPTGSMDSIFPDRAARMVPTYPIGHTLDACMGGYSGRISELEALKLSSLRNARGLVPYEAIASLPSSLQGASWEALRGRRLSSPNDVDRSLAVQQRLCSLENNEKMLPSSIKSAETRLALLQNHAENMAFRYGAPPFVDEGSIRQWLPFSDGQLNALSSAGAHLMDDSRLLVGNSRSLALALSQTDFPLKTTEHRSERLAAFYQLMNQETKVPMKEKEVIRKRSASSVPLLVLKTKRIRKAGTRDRRFNTVAPMSLVASARTQKTNNLQLTGRPPMIIYHSSDSKNLSQYQCYLRDKLELFEATQEELQYNAQKMNKSIVLGQVGIRCRYCSTADPWTRTRGAVYYSASLGGLYQAGQNMSKNHIENTCTAIPEDDRRVLLHLKSVRRRAGGGKDYWSQSAASLGVLEDPFGLRFSKDYPAALAKILASDKK